jgi:hypothetical protein
MSQLTTSTFTGLVSEIRADTSSEVRAALDDEPVNSGDAMLFIKTTRRDIYERRRRRYGQRARRVH